MYAGGFVIFQFLDESAIASTGFGDRLFALRGQPKLPGENTAKRLSGGGLGSGGQGHRELLGAASASCEHPVNFSGESEAKLIDTKQCDVITITASAGRISPFCWGRQCVRGANVGRNATRTQHIPAMLISLLLRLLLEELIRSPFSFFQVAILESRTFVLVRALMYHVSGVLTLPPSHLLETTFLHHLDDGKHMRA